MLKKVTQTRKYFISKSSVKLVFDVELIEILNFKIALL